MTLLGNPRVLVFWLWAMAACVPRQSDPMIEDYDRDGIVDAFDNCVVDAEDRDGFEDEDGCPERARPPAEDGASAAAVDPKTQVEMLRKLVPAGLKRLTVTPTLALLRKSAWGAEFHSKTRAVFFGIGKTFVWVDGKIKISLPHDSYAAAFSPRGRYVALVGDKRFEVVDIDKGSVIQRFDYDDDARDAPETKAARFVSDSELLYFDGCQLVRAPVGVKGEAASVGERHCGRPQVSRNGSVWAIWAQDGEGGVSVWRVTSKDGASTLALGGAGDAPGLSVFAMSPDGRYLCYSRQKDASRLTCRDESEHRDLLIWAEASDGRIAISDGGLLAFGAGSRRTERDLWVVRLGERTLQKLGTLGAKEEWLAFDDHERLLATGGEQLLVFDLAHKSTVTVMLGDGEWEGFAAIPGQSSTFVVGRERKTTRDLFRVEIPAGF